MTATSAAVPLDELGGWRALLGQLSAGQDLAAEHAAAAMTEILAGRATHAQMAAFMVGLRIKGESAEELRGLLDATLAAAAPMPARPDALDIVGTGGSPLGERGDLNVSTMACLVAAGAGARVCKHGNRSASSTSGAFDLLEALGVRFDLDGDGVLRCIDEVGIGFCFARSFHPAFRHAGPVRAELGIRTVFNILGPLANPARVGHVVLGTSDPAMVPVLAEVLRARGAARAVVVAGHDGFDHLTTAAENTVVVVRAGEVVGRELDPERELGLRRVAPEDLLGGDPAANAEIARSVLRGGEGPHTDVVLLNAAAGLFAAGVVDDLRGGLDRARRAVADGRAAAVLDRLVELTAELAP